MCLLGFVDICDHETQMEMENHRLVTAHVETAAALVLCFFLFSSRPLQRCCLAGIFWSWASPRVGRECGVLDRTGMMDTQHLRGKRGNTNVKHEARDAGVWKKRCSLSKQTTTRNEPRFCSSHPGLVLRSFVNALHLSKNMPSEKQKQKKGLKSRFLRRLFWQRKPFKGSRFFSQSNEKNL